MLSFLYDLFNTLSFDSSPTNSLARNWNLDLYFLIHSKLTVLFVPFHHFSTSLPNGYLNIMLHDVLHIPYLGANLVSLDTLHHQGVFVKSSNDGLVVSKDSEELF